MSSKYNPIVRQNDIVTKELEKEVLIYDLRTDKTYCLNETSASVYKLCDGNKSVGEISDLINKKFNANADEDIVWLTLKQLKQENLIAGGDEIDNKFKGMSRREIIMKIGLTSMIALPFISSVVAPTAASASSNGTVACTDGSGSFPCTTAADCPLVGGVDATCNTTTNCCFYDPSGGGIPGGGETGGGGFGVIP